MDIWRITGGNRLEGSCSVQGSKNAALPIIAASLICPAETELQNVPRLSDVDSALRILRYLGCSAYQSGNSVFINSKDVSCSTIPECLMLEMRSSVFFLGALTARCGEVRLSLPGGCRLGKRPIDLHLNALRQMGAEIEENGGEIFCRAYALKGCDIELSFPSVGATENIMLASCAADGRTVIHGAAREPEISALSDYLISLGAEITGAGTSCITVEGFTAREHTRFTVIPDRIAASTLLCCTASAGGDVELKNTVPEHFSTVSDFLRRSGCDIIHTLDSVRIRSEGRLRSDAFISTEPYPGFPTDAQPVVMAALLKAEGTAYIRENIFENRFRQASELVKLGADIEINGALARITGKERLFGNSLEATDLRGGASMIVAALGAEGKSLIYDRGHIARGYEAPDVCLRSLGADITREPLNNSLSASAGQFAL